MTACSMAKPYNKRSFMLYFLQYFTSNNESEAPSISASPSSQEPSRVEVKVA